MPMQRSRWAAAEIGGLVYLHGGYNESTVIQGTLHSFNPATKTFTALAAGQARGFHDAVTINGKMYVFGGLDTSSNFTSTVQCYDPATNTWTFPTVQGATLTGRARHKLVVDGNGFIIMGGVTTGGTAVSTLQRYDTVTQQATTIPGGIGAALFGIADTGSGTVYTSGGYVSAPGVNFDATVLATGANTARAALPSSRYSHVSFYTKSGVYMIGGVPGVAADSTKVMRYTPGTNTWATLGTIPYTVGENAAVAKVGSDVFLFGGNGAAAAQAWKYTP
ncbi:N-acetylneuraminate epimerase [compost metagenome]